MIFHCNGTVLDSEAKSHYSKSMQIPGRVQNGVVVFDGTNAFPEGTRVVVSSLSLMEQELRPAKKRVELPLVSSGEPGSIPLTHERIHAIFDEEDIESMKGTWDVPS